MQKMKPGRVESRLSKAGVRYRLDSGFESFQNTAAAGSEVGGNQLSDCSCQ